jgi:hypothetical protein
MSKYTEVTAAVDRSGISTDYRVHHCVANKNIQTYAINVIIYPVVTE